MYRAQQHALTLPVANDTGAVPAHKRGTGFAFDLDGTITRAEFQADATRFFATLDRRNLYSIYYRLHTAKKPETRARRIAQIVSKLDRGEKFH